MLKWLLNRDNFTFLIAVVGFIMSVYNFVVHILENHTRIKVEVSHVFHPFPGRQCRQTINLKVYNLSQKPVVLSRIVVSNDEHSGSIGSYRRNVFMTGFITGGRQNEKTVWFSDQLPIKIEGNGCANLLLTSDKAEPLFSKGKQNLLEIYTANKKIRYKFQLSSFSETSLLGECREPDLTTQG